MRKILSRQLSNFERSTLRPAFTPDRSITIVAGTTFLVGITAILQLIFSRFPEAFDAFLPFDYDYLTRSLALLFGLTLTYVSFKVLERRRVAWWIALVGSLAVLVAHLLYVRTLPGTAASLVLPTLNVVLLAVFRKEFTILSESRSIVRGFGFLLVAFGVALLYGTVGFLLVDQRDFGASFSLVEALTRAIREVSFIGNNDLQPTSVHAAYFQQSLQLLSFFSAIFAVYSLFRPLTYRLATLPEDRKRATMILERYGRSSQDFFKLHPPDKSYFFAASGETVIAYKVARGIALAMGDPAGPPRRHATAIAEFTEYCHGHGWEPAFAHVGSAVWRSYETNGFRRLKIGEDASVTLARFATETVRRKDFRKVRNRFQREGYGFARSAPPHDSGLLDELAAVSEAWLTLPGRQERGFALGYFSKAYVSQTPVFVARDASGRVAAFANEVPSYRPGDATIDLMRHRLDIPNGLMDWLLMQVMGYFHEAGYRTFDLGFSPLSGLGEEPDSSLEEEVLGYLAARTNRWFAFKGLRDYKEKFAPEWEERWLVYRGGRTNLVRTAVASVLVMKV